MKHGPGVVGENMTLCTAHSQNQKIDEGISKAASEENRLAWRISPFFPRPARKSEPAKCKNEREVKGESSLSWLGGGEKQYYERKKRDEK